MKKHMLMIKTEWAAGNKLIGYWVISFILLLSGSLLPYGKIIPDFLRIDALVHIVLYSILSFTPMVLLKNRQNAFLASIVITPFGYLLETIAMQITGGSFNAFNAIANNVGVLAGMAAGFIVRLKNHYHPDNENDTQQEPKN